MIVLLGFSSFTLQLLFSYLLSLLQYNRSRIFGNITVQFAFLSIPWVPLVERVVPKANKDILCY